MEYNKILLLYNTVQYNTKIQYYNNIKFTRIQYYYTIKLQYYKAMFTGTMFKVIAKLHYMDDLNGFR